MSSDGSLRIVAQQLEVFPAQPERNTDSVLSRLESCRKDADIVVFPEMCVPGYLVGDTWERADFIRRCEDCHEIILKASQGLTLIFGSVGSDPRHLSESGRLRLYNAAHVYHDGVRQEASHLNLPFWPKTLMANYREFEDSRHFYDLRKWAQDCNQQLPDAFQPYVRPPLHARQPQVALGLTICEDAWCDDYSWNPLEHLAPNSDVLINLSASPFSLGKDRKRQSVFNKRAETLNRPVLYVNGVGVQNNGKNIYVFEGRSRAHTPSPHDSGECRSSPLKAFHADQKSYCFQMPQRELRERDPSPAPNDGFSPTTLSDLCQGLQQGLRHVLQEWNIQHVVIGASGGIDSSVSAALFRSVMPADRLTLVNMPTLYNSQQTQNAAALLGKNLETAYVVVPLSPALEQTKRDLFAPSAPFAGLLTPSVFENLQARDRGSRLLAAIAAAKEGVFSCNANKTELTVGYSTLYGDAAGFLAPLGDLWKGQVYALGRHLNECVFAKPVIPQACFDMPPSAELSEEQDITQGRGDPLIYPYHDALFRTWVEGWQRLSLQDTVEAWKQGNLHHRLGLPADGIPPALRTGSEFLQDTMHWWKLYTGMAAFKRVQTPPILSVSQRAFGNDHRECVGVSHQEPLLPASLFQELSQNRLYKPQDSL